MTDTACACGSCPDCGSPAPPPGPLAAERWAHGAIRDRLLGRIGRVNIAGQRPLAGLTTRAGDDPAIALVDAFAGGLHVLAWNAGRLADDGTLARGTDRAAMAALVGLTGYRPRPALSATTWLAFTLDDFVGAPAEVIIPKGNRVASVPKPGELPVNFETDAELVARPEWSSLAPVVPTAATIPTTASTSIEIAGSSSVQAGDTLLLTGTLLPAGTVGWIMARAAAVERVADADPPFTRIRLAEVRGLSGGVGPAGEHAGRVVILARRSQAFGANAPDPLLLLKPTGASGTDLVAAAIDATATPPEWKNLTLNVEPSTGDTIDVDGSRPEIVAGRVAVLTAGAVALPVRISSAIERGRNGFGLSGRVTRTVFAGLDMNANNPILPPSQVRGTTILLESGREALLARPVNGRMPAANSPDRLTVRGAHTLPAGRRLLLTGLTASGAAQEIVTLARATVQAGNTLLVFTAPVATPFQAVGLAVLGNVVAASHGESVAAGAEPVGTGDASRSGQRVMPGRAPVSMLPAATPSGYAAALELRVAGRRFDVVEQLYGLPADAQAAMLASRDDGKAELTFAGRLPSGAAITALYRAGAGAAGNLAVGRLTTLLAPLPGVRSVTNPVPADGGSDAETLDLMRTSAPRQLRSFDRVVALADYQAFAEGWRGIGKALASEVMLGMRRVVVVTVATSSLAPPSADAINALAKALRGAGPPGAAVIVQGFQPLVPQIGIALSTDPALIRADVEAAVRTRLGAVFGAAARGFAQGLPQSAVLAEVQGVAGVRHCALTQFLLGNVGPDRGRLLCPGPQPVRDAGGNWSTTLAGLLAIDPVAISFTERAP